MLFYTVGQSRVFLAMLYAGLLIGLYASLDGAARRLFDAGRILALFMDLLLGLVAGLIVLAALLLAADGELRLYALLGVICGYLVYLGTLGPALRAILRHLFRPLRRLARWLSQRKIIQKVLR